MENARKRFCIVPPDLHQLVWLFLDCLMDYSMLPNRKNYCFLRHDSGFWKYSYDSQEQNSKNCRQISHKLRTDVEIELVK